MMKKHCKFTASIQIPTRIERELRDGSFQIATTIIFCISIAFFVVILGIFINNRVKTLVVTQDLYFPPALNTPSSSSHSLCNSPSNSTSLSGLKHWLDLRTKLWHMMSDEELMWAASMASGIAEYPFDRTPKVAFMFLIRRDRLPLAPFWEMFFRGHDGLFSIYIHGSPDFISEPPNSSVFYKRRIPSKAVEWGKSSMIDAERRLLANALLDISNERFVLLSDSCIPLYNFTTIYNYLINSTHSYLSLFDDPTKIGRGRYNKRMWPTLALSDWRKGSQWFEVHRKLAIHIVSDVTYYNVFRDLCKPPCYMDEHYFPTLVTKICPELTSNRTVTWVDWSRGGSHPTTFKREDVNERFLMNRVRSESNCRNFGGIESICFLFARKFHPNTLQPLMQIAPVVFGFQS